MFAFSLFQRVPRYITFKQFSLITKSQKCSIKGEGGIVSVILEKIEKTKCRVAYLKWGYFERWGYFEQRTFSL